MESNKLTATQADSSVLTQSTLPKDLPLDEAKILEDKEQTFTFAVDNVKICTKTPQLLATAENIVREVLQIKEKPEDFSHRKNKNAVFVQGQISGFLLALHTAFQSHYILKLSVSDFIILIGQGLGKHINNNAEDLRQYFVAHEGKEEIRIIRDEFLIGKQNDWSTVFGEFSQEIKKRVKNDIYDVVVDDTSVATKDSRIVSEITLMDCMQSYFAFTAQTSCGIPQITLEGKKEDWEKLRQKVHKLVEMNKDDCLKLDFWLKQLVPVVEEICETAINRKANVNFWNSIYKYQRKSGGDNVTGWCTVFFPYLTENAVNQFVPTAGIKTSDIPKQVSKVPFTWDYYSKPIPMSFYGGFLGAQFNKDTSSVEPTYFWSVVYDESKKK